MSCLSRMSNGSAICSSTLPLQGSVVCNFDTVVLLKIDSSQLETKSCSTRFSGISPDLGEDCYAVEPTYRSNLASFYSESLPELSAARASLRYSRCRLPPRMGEGR